MHELYGLTGDEIAIVEETTANEKGEKEEEFLTTGSTGSTGKTEEKETTYPPL